MKITERQSIFRIVIVLIIIAVIILISIFTEKNNQKAMAAQSYDTLQLFNGNDLDDWTIVLKDSLADPDSTFYVKQGHIYTTGEPFGYIRTNESFSDYRLLVEWRWVDEPGNSGVFLHIQDDKIWPVCLECQLMNQKAGDFVCFPGFDFKEHVNKEEWAVAKFEESSEKPSGEWNLYDIRVVQDSVTIYVNDVLQNIATETNYSEGYIALQSEGAPLEFRNVYLLRRRSNE
ncbi:MAG: 3-keto-disaccharide hydrolase [Bacteroidales bacterium]